VGGVSGIVFLFVLGGGVVDGEKGIGYRGEGIGDVLVDADVDEVLVLFCCVLMDGDVGMVVLVAVLAPVLICIRVVG